MALPRDLQAAIEKEIESRGMKMLAEAREQLTVQYRKEGSKKPLIETQEQRLAYVISRMPATFSAVCQALKAIMELNLHLEVKSLLDLGAGPGTVYWAAKEFFPALQTATLLERDGSLAQLGQKLASKEAIQWQLADLEQVRTIPSHDLVVFSYSIGELTPDKIPPLIDTAWHSTKQLLLIIEPGTPAGFERIRAIRQQLIAKGAYLAAPCPHSQACPMSGGDWCHFAARVERTSIHRQVKGGTLGYEDEKFSYIAFSKEPCPLPQARILRHPLHRSGHSHFTLCTKEGIQEVTLSKRNPEAYKAARKASWGDVITDVK